MDDKKIKSAVGNVTCGIFMGIGGLTIAAGVLFLVWSLIESTRAFPLYALYVLGAGLSIYAVGAIIWNLTEITVNSRMILRELQRRENTADPSSEK
jgi:cytochrome c biogenesis protein CcdA